MKMTEQQQRQTAYKIQIGSILKGDFVKQEGWNPNYIIDEYGRKISRVNLMTTIIDIPDSQETFNYYSLILDDGTGRISTRIFENHDRLKKFSLGEIIQIIGRIREYGEEKYIVPEIIKKIENPKWIEIRKKEIELLNKTPKEEPKKETHTNIVKEVTIEETEQIDSSEIIILAIRDLDKGNGADIDDVISKCKLEKGEELINSLLLEGDIFEIKPGRLKILD